GRSKEISEDLRKRVVDAHQAGKGYRMTSKDSRLHQSTVRRIVYKCRKFNTTVTLPRSGRPTKITPRARRIIFREITKNPRVMSKDLQASLALANVSVHESTIRQTLNKDSKKEATTLQEEHCYWKNVLWTDESKIELFGLNEKHYAMGPGRFAIIDRTMNSVLYQQILQENVRVTFCDLKLNRRWVLQQDNNPKHTSQSTKEWLKQKKFFKLGSVELHAVSEPIEVIKELISHGLEHSTELQARNQHLQEENEKLRREWEYVTGELEKYVQAKETLERDLYTRFALVLNEKKAKIRSLQQKLNHLQGDMESVKGQRRDTAAVESKNPEEPDYEGTTDEENEENNACSQSSASARDKPGQSSLDVSLNDSIDVAPSRKRRQRHVRGQESDAKKGSKEGQEKGRVGSASKTSDVSNEAPQGSTDTASSAPEPEDLFDDI
ncbi:XRCC4 protein, partial [Atractosteus spatula]|nr:XRCC4 protein [Atractosteus spatula]